MKNCFLIALICILLVPMALSGCGKDNVPDHILESPETTSESTPPETDPTGVPPEPSENLPTEDPSDITEPSEPEDDVVRFEDVDETVYALKAAETFYEPSTDEISAGKLVRGNSYQRTGISNNGWSRIRRQGRTLYVRSEHLSTNNPNTSTNTSTNTGTEDTVYAGPTVTQNEDGSVTIDYTTTGNPFFAGGRVTSSSSGSIYINGVRCCKKCEKPWGNGTSGTCNQFLNDMQCPECGAHVPALTCHSCDEAA